MKNYYEVLGLNNSASADEIRRAYRILARRYHPDVNPGKASAEKFREIAQAYEVLSSPDTRQKYDSEAQDSIRSQAHKAYQQAHRRSQAIRRPSAQERFTRSTSQSSKLSADSTTTNSAGVDSIFGTAKKIFSHAINSIGNSTEAVVKHDPQIRSVSILEVSISMRDAINGVRRSVEVPEGKRIRKVSVVIPPGTKPGALLRLRDRTNGQELVFIIRVASDPLLCIENKGLVMQVPITINEAVFGASITVPTLDDPVVVRVPAGIQSGSELRLKSKGITLRDGTRGDLILRLMIKTPTGQESLVKLKDALEEIEKCYDPPVRAELPKTIPS